MNLGLGLFPNCVRYRKTAAGRSTMSANFNTSLQM